MERILFVALSFLTAIAVLLYYRREHLTMQELEKQNEATSKKLEKVEDEFKALQQKITDQEDRMKQASAQAAAAKASLEAIH